MADIRPKLLPTQTCVRFHEKCVVRDVQYEANTIGVVLKEDVAQLLQRGYAEAIAGMTEFVPVGEADGEGVLTLKPEADHAPDFECSDGGLLPQAEPSADEPDQPAQQADEQPAAPIAAADQPPQ